MKIEWGFQLQPYSLVVGVQVNGIIMLMIHEDVGHIDFIYFHLGL
jgi:hypothetical protein